jgi:hypothetical protein
MHSGPSLIIASILAGETAAGAPGWASGSLGLTGGSAAIMEACSVAVAATVCSLAVAEGAGGRVWVTAAVGDGSGRVAVAVGAGIGLGDGSDVGVAEGMGNTDGAPSGGAPPSRA